MWFNAYAEELLIRERQHELERKAATAWMFERPRDAGPQWGRRLLRTTGDLLIAVGQSLRGQETISRPIRDENAPLHV